MSTLHPVLIAGQWRAAEAPTATFSADPTIAEGGTIDVHFSEAHDPSAADTTAGFRYSFALTTHRSAFDPTAAMKFSLEHQNPLVTGLITGERGNDTKSFEWQAGKQLRTAPALAARPDLPMRGRRRKFVVPVHRPQR